MTYALLGSVITHYFDWLRAVIDQSLSLCLAYFLIHKVSALFKWFCVALLVHDNDLLSGCWCFVWSSPARPACPLGPSRWWRRPVGRSGAARSHCMWPGCLLAWAPWEQSPSPSPSLKHERVRGSREHRQCLLRRIFYLSYQVCSKPFYFHLLLYFLWRCLRCESEKKINMSS